MVTAVCSHLHGVGQGQELEVGGGQRLDVTGGQGKAVHCGQEVMVMVGVGGLGFQEGQGSGSLWFRGAECMSQMVWDVAGHVKLSVVQCMMQLKTKILVVFSTPVDLFVTMCSWDVQLCCRIS